MSSPNWYNGKSINEVEFCTEFVQNRPLKCIGGKLYSIDGEVSDSEICHDISVMLTEFVTTGISRTFIGWLKSNEDKYKIKYVYHIPNRDGGHVRGFRGVKTKYVPIVL